MKDRSRMTFENLARASAFRCRRIARTEMQNLLRVE
jgi:hypothetical protein